MYLIAQRFGICLEELIAANPQVKDPNLIYPGQVLCIPRAKPVPDKGPCPLGFSYTVKPGDTLHSIASMFGVSVEQLLAANPQIKDPHCISPGQQICIPVKVPKKHHCHCFCLHPTHHCTAGMGMGMYNADNRELMVFTRGLPAPEHFGMDRMVMMAGCDNWDEFETAEMRPVTPEIMTCHHRMHFSSNDPVILIAPVRRFPLAFGPVLLVAVVRF
ncbi:MAG: LysM peptidoglycan-binding domain-containing protein [Clostridia bacterium]|nr:LysM peptidoglycan-binding domain-containing protein [Clostridia bacterium]